MEILQSLEIYTMAQKSVGTQFILLAIFLLVIGSVAHFMGTTPLANGLKVGAVITGILILAGGIGYFNFSNGVQRKGFELYEKDPKQFIETETVRMEKVVNDYMKYQMVFAAFIVVSLAVVLFVRRPYWTGVSFAVILLFVSAMIIEAFSHLSIHQYFKDLNS